MHIAQCLAGMAFSNALLGISQSLAHKTGAIFHIPHGCSNIIYLPYIIQWNRTVSEKTYAEIARYIRLSGNNDKELYDSYVEFIRDFNRKLIIPLSLKEYGIKEDNFKSNLQRISENAEKDACTGSNSRETKAADFEKTLTAIYYGNDIDF
ncbi:MAG: iron-containing alcohol dehydrogenase [Salinivirgaceae bacterium]|nr:iron-containing alcohol dehydrogenase [Salinivirgaceae bacterium]